MCVKASRQLVSRSLRSFLSHCLRLSLCKGLSFAAHRSLPPITDAMSKCWNPFFLPRHFLFFCEHHRTFGPLQRPSGPNRPRAPQSTVVLSLSKFSFTFIQTDPWTCQKSSALPTPPSCVHREVPHSFICIVQLIFPPPRSYPPRPRPPSRTSGFSPDAPFISLCVRSMVAQILFCFVFCFVIMCSMTSCNKQWCLS